MKMTLTILAILAALPAGAALAGDDCRVPQSDWQPRDAVVKLAEKNGWTLQEIEIDDGCYEIEALTREGRRIEVKLDPGTLAVIEIEKEDDDTKRAARGPAPAGAVAPAANGQTGAGTSPEVKSN